jgi:C-terminal peptidase prc
LRNDVKVLDFTLIRQPIQVKGVSSFLWKNSAKQIINHWLHDNDASKDLTHAQYLRDYFSTKYPILSSKLGNDVGIIRIRQFTTSTTRDMVQALNSFALPTPTNSQSSSHNVGLLIIDLRENSGGVLQSAIDSGSLFLPERSTMVFVIGPENKLKDTKMTFLSPYFLDGSENVMDETNESVYPDLQTPIVILINSNTASAAEVFAAAMEEQGRAVLIGTQSFGKGIIQSIREIENGGGGSARGGGISVTTAKYETPLHHNIHKIGITPDLQFTQCETNKNPNELAVCLETLVENKRE